MSEVLRGVLAPAAVLALAIGAPATAKAQQEGGVQLGPATSAHSVYKHHEVSNGDVEQNFTYVNGSLRELESITTRHWARYDQSGNLISDTYTLRRDKKYDEFGRLMPYLPTCKLARFINSKSVSVHCVIPASEAPKPQPQPVFLFRDLGDGDFVPVGGIARAA